MKSIVTPKLGELLGFDLETTGVNRFFDVPVSYALITSREMVVTERVAGIVDPGRDIPSGATSVHGISSDRARREGIALSDAVQILVDKLVSTSERGIAVVGMRVDYDLTIVDVQAKKFLGMGLADLGWHGPVLDVSVLDRHFDKFRKGSRTLGQLCAHYSVPMVNAHDATADAQAALDVFGSLSIRYPEVAKMSREELYASQMEWHRQWASSYDLWRTKRNLKPMDPRDYVWPIAS